jgi:pimeloyl-ACP methyl ester carboxylesterase
MAALRRAALLALPVAALLAGPPLRAAAQAPARVEAPAPSAPRELVVLVHGMGRTAGSMRPMARALEAEGFEVLNVGYSSTCCEVPQLGAQLRDSVLARVTARHTAVHFVGHSLGGILIRWVLTRDTLPPRVGRVVMLAPPNRGSRAADRYAPVVDWLMPPISELRTDSTSTVRTLPPLRGIEVGVIAGDDDGKVEVEETHLEGETDHLVVDGVHSFLMRDRTVQKQTVAFLRTGRFMREPVVGPIP